MSWKGDKQRHSLASRGVETTRKYVEDAYNLTNRAERARKLAAKSIQDRLRELFPNLTISVHEHQNQVIIYVKLHPTNKFWFRLKDDMKAEFNNWFDSEVEGIELEGAATGYNVPMIMFTSYYDNKSLALLENDIKTLESIIKRMNHKKNIDNSMR